MTFGLALPIADLEGGPLTSGSIARNARLIEAAGFSSIWTFDAMGRGFLLPDPLTSLAIAASVTDHLTVGTGILQLTHRSMPDVASRVLTMATELGDRFVLGVGPGSTRKDFTLFGSDFASRFETFEDKLAELRSFLETGQAAGRVLAPTPPNATVSIALAGWRGAMIERAAAEGCGWIASGFHASDDELSDGLDRYRAAGGRRAVVTNVRAAELSAAVERAHHLAAMGFDDVVLMDPTLSADRLAELVDGLGLAGSSGRFDGTAAVPVRPESKLE